MPASTPVIQLTDVQQMCFPGAILFKRRYVNNIYNIDVHITC